MSAITSSKTSAVPVRCDSCGEPASPEHIRDRILRLERSTRYRPIHISLLLICTAPPMRAEDDLYALEMDAGAPSRERILAACLHAWVLIRLRIQAPRSNLLNCSTAESILLGLLSARFLLALQTLISLRVTARLF